MQPDDSEPDSLAKSVYSIFCGNHLKPARDQNDAGRLCLCCFTSEWQHREMVYKDYLIAYVLKAKAKQRRRIQATQHDTSSLNDAVYFAQPASAYLDKQIADTVQNGFSLYHRGGGSVRQPQQRSDVVGPDRQQHIQYHVVQQLQVPKDTLLINAVPQGGATPPEADLRHAQVTPEADLVAASKHVRGSQHDSCTLAAGSMLFGAFLFICGSAPWLLPAFYLLFAAVCLPWRIQQFYKNSQGFFLLDFCYVSSSLSTTAIVQHRYTASLTAAWLMTGHVKSSGLIAC